ncbi:9730_t:CDS:1 [Funneliformis mosseae]|uniref:9730_t:CDS:1 n=1 Tax=Funneliformis mosseae TaxID=27381 RepID=A0A9N9FKJ6_FUNMO|nr:9730_t:CDS:1 [Funneliformis mosseae]
MSNSSTSSTSSASSKPVMHHTNLPKINISTTSDYLLSSKPNAIVIFPEGTISDEPMAFDDEALEFSLISNCPSPIERKMEKYKKLRAIHERAGRLPKGSDNSSN